MRKGLRKDIGREREKFLKVGFREVREERYFKDREDRKGYLVDLDIRGLLVMLGKRVLML